MAATTKESTKDVLVPKHKLREAADTIRRLRHSNQIMGEKLQLVEGILELRHLRGPDCCASPDIGFELERLGQE